jgi:hypothetical protein
VAIEIGKPHLTTSIESDSFRVLTIQKFATDSSVFLKPAHRPDLGPSPSRTLRVQWVHPMLG